MLVDSRRDDAGSDDEGTVVARLRQRATWGNAANPKIPVGRFLYPMTNHQLLLPVQALRHPSARASARCLVPTSQRTRLSQTRCVQRILEHICYRMMASRWYRRQRPRISDNSDNSVQPTLLPHFFLDVVLEILFALSHPSSSLRPLLAEVSRNNRRKPPYLVRFLPRYLGSLLRLLCCRAWHIANRQRRAQGCLGSNLTDCLLGLLCDLFAFLNRRCQRLASLLVELVRGFLYARAPCIAVSAPLPNAKASHTNSLLDRLRRLLALLNGPSQRLADFDIDLGRRQQSYCLVLGERNSHR